MDRAARRERRTAGEGLPRLPGAADLTEGRIERLRRARCATRTGWRGLDEFVALHCGEPASLPFLGRQKLLSAASVRMDTGSAPVFVPKPGEHASTAHVGSMRLNCGRSRRDVIGET
jgi:hypothetical protein